MIRLRLENAQRVAAAMERRADRLRKEMGDAAYTAATLVKGAVQKRVFMPRQVSKQDAPRKMRITRRSPVGTRVDRSSATALVSVGAHWTPARSKAIQRLVPASELTRTFLKIRRPLLLGSGARRVKAIQDEKRLKISRYKWLDEWARRPEKGEQIRRHVIRMKSPDARMSLLLAPAVKEKEQDVIKIFRLSALAAVLG